MKIAVAALIYFSGFGFAFGQGVTITSPQQPGPTDSNPIPVDIRFSGPVDDLNISDFNLINGQIQSLNRTNVDFIFQDSKSLSNFRINRQFSFSDISNIDQIIEEELGDAVISIDFNANNELFYLTLKKGVFKFGVAQPVISGEFFETPLDMVINQKNGNLIVADSEAGKVYIFDSTYTLIKTIGNGSNADSENPRGATGLAIDGEGNIYVADNFTGNTANQDAIKIYTPNGNYLDRITSYNGQQIEDPFRIAVDKNNNIYLSESGGDDRDPRVIIFDKDYSSIASIQGGEQGNPGSLMVDNFGYLYVVNYENDFNLTDLVSDPLKVINNYNTIKSKRYTINVFNTNSNFDFIKEFDDTELNLPIDIALNNCGLIKINNLKLSGPGPSNYIFGYPTKIDATFDFTLKTFQRQDFFKAEIVPENQGLVQISMENVDLFPCDPQPEGKFQIEYQDEESNEAPVANTDSYTTNFETQLTIGAASGVLSNDNDANGDDLTASVRDNVTNGTLNLNPDGSFTYTPDDGFSGPDTFTYVASDGILDSEEVTVTILVDEEPNTAPVGITDSYTTNFETQLTIGASSGVLSNDSDADGDDITASLRDNVVNGTLNLNPDGSFTYTPDNGFTGPDTFTYVANDGVLDSEEVTVTILVGEEPNTPPVGNTDFYTTNFETQLTISASSGVLSNDTDANGDELTASLRDNVANGILVFNADGSFTYTPDNGFSGPDTFTYVASDGDLESEEINVTINVLPEPTFDCPNPNDFEPITLAENCDFEVPDYRGSVTNFQNIEDPVVRQTYIRKPDVVSVTLEVYDGNELVGDCTFDVPVLDESAPEILNCDSLNETVAIQEGGMHQLGNYTQEVEVRECSSYNVTQEPQAGTSINETTQVTITVTDDSGLTDTCTFAVEVREETEILEITCPGSYAVLADENCVYKVPDFTGIATANIDGAVIGQDIEAGSVFQPNSDPYVTVTATFEDQSDSCRIYLSPVDEEDPVAWCVGDTEIRLADGETIKLNAEDYDAGSTDNCQIATYTLDRNSLSSADEGENVITLTVNDAAGNLDTCEFTVNVIVEEPGEIDFSCLIVEYKVTPDENCEYFLPDFSEILEYSPAEADFEQSIDPGTELFNDEEVEVTVSYQGETKTCNLYVSLVEDQPQAVCRSDFQIQLNEGETVTIQPEDLDNGSFANCSEISLSLDKTEFTSADLGTNMVTLTVTDEEGNTATCQTTVNVILNGSGVNQSPVGIDEEYTTNINTTLEISASNGVLVNDTDPENDELTAILQDDVSNGTLDLNADGSFTYTPDQDFLGQDYFTYMANDGELNSNIIFVSINVEDGNGEFSCVDRITLSLNSEGSAELNIEDLYSGNAEGIEFGATERFFSCEDIGENTVTLVYTGRQEGSCEIMVEVLDMSAPVLALNDLEVSLNESGVAIITFNDLDAGSGDNCNEEVIYTLSESAFTCKNLGENQVLVTAEDNSGNSSTRTAMVTVLDNEGFCNDFGEGSEYIFIYPNPNTGSFKIATPADVLIERIEVFDHRGRFIAARDYESAATEYPMEVGPLQESVYVVKIVTNERTLTKRFIFKY